MAIVSTSNDKPPDPPSKLGASADFNNCETHRLASAIPDLFAYRQVKRLIFSITQEIKARGISSSNVLLPFQALDHLNTFIERVFPNGEMIPVSSQSRDALSPLLASFDEYTLVCALKFLWSRLPNNELIGMEVYNAFAQQERDAGFPENAFVTILPLLLHSSAQASIVYDFFDLIVSSVASQKSSAKLSGRKIAKICSIWAFRLPQLHPESFDAGLKCWKLGSDAIFHLFLAFLRALLPLDSAALQIPKVLLNHICTNSYPPGSGSDIADPIITVPYVRVISTHKSRNCEALIDKVRLNLKFANKNEFSSLESYTILKRIYHGKDLHGVIESLGNESSRMLRKLEEFPLTELNLLYSGWNAASENVDRDIPLYSEVSTNTLECSEYFVWAWLATMAREQHPRIKGMFGTSLMLNFQCNGLKKWTIISEQYLSKTDYMGFIAATRKVKSLLSSGLPKASHAPRSTKETGAESTSVSPPGAPTQARPVKSMLLPLEPFESNETKSSDLLNYATLSPPPTRPPISHNKEISSWFDQHFQPNTHPRDSSKSSNRLSSDKPLPRISNDHGFLPDISFDNDDFKLDMLMEDSDDNPLKTTLSPPSSRSSMSMNAKQQNRLLHPKSDRRPPPALKKGDYISAASDLRLLGGTSEFENFLLFQRLSFFSDTTNEPTDAQDIADLYAASISKVDANSAAHDHIVAPNLAPLPFDDSDEARHVSNHQAQSVESERQISVGHSRQHVSDHNTIDKQHGSNHGLQTPPTDHHTKAGPPEQARSERVDYIEPVNLGRKSRAMAFVERAFLKKNLNSNSASPVSRTFHQKADDRHHHMELNDRLSLGKLTITNPSPDENEDGSISSAAYSLGRKTADANQAAREAISSEKSLPEIQTETGTVVTTGQAFDSDSGAISAQVWHEHFSDAHQHVVDALHKRSLDDKYVTLPHQPIDATLSSLKTQSEAPPLPSKGSESEMNKPVETLTSHSKPQDPQESRELKPMSESHPTPPKEVTFTEPTSPLKFHRNEALPSFEMIPDLAHRGSIAPGIQSPSPVNNENPDAIFSDSVATTTVDVSTPNAVTASPHKASISTHLQSTALSDTFDDAESALHTPSLTILSIENGHAVYSPQESRPAGRVVPKEAIIDQEPRAVNLQQNELDRNKVFVSNSTLPPPLELAPRQHQSIETGVYLRPKLPSPTRGSFDRAGQNAISREACTAQHPQQANSHPGFPMAGYQAHGQSVYAPIHGAIADSRPYHGPMPFVALPPLPQTGGTWVFTSNAGVAHSISSSPHTQSLTSQGGKSHIQYGPMNSPSPRLHMAPGVVPSVHQGTRFYHAGYDQHMPHPVSARVASNAPIAERHSKNKPANRANLRAAFNDRSFGI